MPSDNHPHVTIEPTDAQKVYGEVHRWWPRAQFNEYHASRMVKKYARHGVYEICRAIEEQYDDYPDSKGPNDADIGRRLARINPRTVGQAISDDDAATIRSLRAPLRDWIKEQCHLSGIANELWVRLDESAELTNDGERLAKICEVENWVNRWIRWSAPLWGCLNQREGTNAKGERTPSGIRAAAMTGPAGECWIDRTLDDAEWRLRGGKHRRSGASIRGLAELGPVTRHEIEKALFAIGAARSELAYVRANPWTETNADAPSVPVAESGVSVDAEDEKSSHTKIQPGLTGLVAPDQDDIPF